jgi:RNA polymerase sigma factor (sigma-70 family)
VREVVSNIVTVDQFKSDLEKYGPDYVVELVCEAYEKRIKKFIFRRLDRLNYKLRDQLWGRCIDPDDHKEDVTQDTFLEFSEYTQKFAAGKCKKEIINLESYLFGISKNNCFDHLKQRRCSDLPPMSTDYLDVVDYQLQAENSGREIEDNLIFKQAKDSLPDNLREVLEDRVAGLSHEEISIKRGITNVDSRQHWHKAIHKFRRFRAKKRN